jgi:hypothetical protein
MSELILLLLVLIRFVTYLIYLITHVLRNTFWKFTAAIFYNLFST